MRASRAFEAKAIDVRAARVFALRATADWSVKASDVETVVGELAANAYIHARCPFTVSVDHFDSRVSIEVADESPKQPVLDGDPSVDRLHGRGLQMVQAVARRWGTRTTHEGKVVWAELAAPPP